MSRRKTPKNAKPPKPIGGGWYLLDGGTKIQGRAKAYRTAGLDPDVDGNRRSDAAKQRRRKPSIEERRSRVAALLVRRTPYRRISQLLGVSLATVADDVATIRRGWREDAYGDIAEYVLDELAVLDADEFDLRVQYANTRDPDTKLKTYDRIARIMARRAELLGLDAPTARRLLVSEKEDTATVFVAGGSEEDYVAALAAAQGLEPGRRRLRAVP